MLEEFLVIGLTVLFSVEVFLKSDVLAPCSEEGALSEGLEVVGVGHGVVSLLLRFSKNDVLHPFNLGLAASNETEGSQVELLVGLLSEIAEGNDDVSND